MSFQCNRRQHSHIPKSPGSPAPRTELRRLAALFVGVTLSAGPQVAPADVVELEPIDAKVSTQDGELWTIDHETITLYVSRSSSSQQQSRAVLEYSLANIPPGSAILSATIDIRLAVLGTPPTPVIELHGYGGDGVLEISDALVPSNMIAVSAPVDLADLLGNWGPCEGCSTDFNGAGLVNPVDLAQLLGAWGECE